MAQVQPGMGSREQREQEDVESIFKVLKREHQEVSEMMEIISAESTGEDLRERTFQKMYRALLSHAKSEEEVFYPRLLGAEGTREITMEAFQEHRVVSGLLSELQDMATRGETWQAKFKVLKENVEHHVEEEENEMFSKARRVLSHEEERDIASAFLAAKQKHLQSLS